MFQQVSSFLFINFVLEWENRLGALLSAFHCSHYFIALHSQKTSLNASNIFCKNFTSFLNALIQFLPNPVKLTMHSHAVRRILQHTLHSRKLYFINMKISQNLFHKNNSQKFQTYMIINKNKSYNNNKEGSSHILSSKYQLPNYRNQRKKIVAIVCICKKSVKHLNKIVTMNKQFVKIMHKQNKQKEKTKFC